MKIQKNHKTTKSCSIVIPCYNEEGNIEQCIDRIPRFLGDLEVIIVNDGSTDRTLSISKLIKEKTKDLEIKIITYEKNHGKSYAIKRAFNKAEKEILVILDADMTSPPEELPEIIEPIANGQYDFVNGSRFIYPMSKDSMSTLHRYGNFIFTFFMNYLLKIQITDCFCGYKALKKKDFDDKKIRLKNRNKWPDLDLLMHAKMSGLKICEVPTHHTKRIGGKKKMKTFTDGMSLCFNFIHNLFLYALFKTKA